MANRYSIDVTIDFVNRHVTGFEKIFLTNKPYKRLLLGFDLPSWNDRSRLEISIKGEPLNLVPTEATDLQQEGRFYFELPDWSQDEDTITLECSFNGRLPDPQREMVSLIESWHPKIQSDKMTFDDYEVTANLPRNQVLITTGLEINTEPLGARQDMS